jgi:membrane carboxypeptidase/penicillin-binding protein PbpC
LTEKELQQQIDRAMQDAITLDYSKWATQQRQAKLSTDHDLWQIERDRTLARMKSDNAEARARRLNKLDGERIAKQSESDAQTELELAPEKRRLEREWLANNQGATAADFEKKAWHLLRVNLIERRRAEAFEAEKQRAAGRYAL